MPLATQLNKGHPPRVLLDNELVVDALLSGSGLAARLRQAWLTHRCRPIGCQATLLDLMQRMRQPQLGLTSAEQQALLSEYLPYVLRVRLPASIADESVRPARLPWLQLALASRAHAIVTPDPVLLSARERLPFSVLELDPFVQLLRRPLQEPRQERRRHLDAELCAA
ncbi:MAG: hypothetical protein RJA44_101 [Pseudomonadota bacterium]